MREDDYRQLAKLMKVLHEERGIDTLFLSEEAEAPAGQVGGT